MLDSIANLFSSDENIWTIALIGLGLTFVVMLGKSMVMAVVRRKKSRSGPG